MTPSQEKKMYDAKQEGRGWAKEREQNEEGGGSAYSGGV
jgi:hypothetical protein